MKVVLNADISTLGHKGDIVEVAPGYARNYLLPRNLALSASRGAVKQAETMRRSRTERERRERGLADALAGRIVGAALRIPARAGEDGQLFGSVTNADIAEALTQALGEDIDRRRISLAAPIRSLGTHDYAVHIRPDVTAAGTVEVVPQT
jgi:large subunit ribosomal protein L9